MLPCIVECAVFSGNSKRVYIEVFLTVNMLRVVF